MGVMRAGRLMAVVCLLTGCSHLPVSGPNHFDIQGEAVELNVKDSRNQKSVISDYVLLDINRQVLENTEGIGPEFLL